MAYADQQMSGNKAVSIVIVALIHVAVGYLLISGLAISAAKKIIERVDTFNVEEPPPPPEEPDEPPPEEPQQETAPPPPVAPPPPINIAPQPPQIRTQREIPPPSPPALTLPPPAPAAPPAPPSQARGVQPRNQSRWVRRIIEDYPSRALRQEEEGTVGVRVTVGANGRVSACSVTASSGSSILDDAACRSLQRYARFEPALNDAGDPTTGSWATRITYQIR
ncbi:energy transducer TonB [Erythrobacter sp. HL-111]|uniref:energy transducer TonB n=1 Tax=Erythrobacter sp. HL-111 TaxID=1798193 RepID=UPI0006DAFC7F|nr:energy transducer TonB [Erythrobacter sp. HL-111]KPP94153.1 MAG: periplasmic protein TonB [Erythrobacteraceae bacterium HL-111]SDS65152.1 outer membrane transport energization protein TonB [Erythrobacter sp. HL-111]